MSNSLFISNHVEWGDVSQAVLASQMYVTDSEAGTLNLDEGDTAVIQATSAWNLLALRVIGNVSVETASTDWDNVTPITGTVESYGIAKYPGTFCQVTKAATFTLTAGTGGATVEYLKATLVDDSAI